VSEISLNIPPSPELLNTAAPGLARPRPVAAGPAPGLAKGPADPGATTAPNPFAALLAGVLGGTQPAAAGTPPAPAGEAFAELAARTETPDPAVPLALPGMAPALPAVATGTPGGNGLPATGNPLPLVTAPAQAPGPAPRAPVPATAEGTDPATSPESAARPRISLADLALTKPVDPGSSPATEPAAAPADGARQAAAFTLAGRSLLAAGNPAGETPTRSPVPAGLVAPATANRTTPELPTPNVLTGSDATTRHLPVADSGRIPVLPGAGTEFLAGQFAAFAAGGDTGTTTPTATSGLAGGSATDAGSAALLNRLGSTGLPPLQPLGNPGAFAGGLADRLLTLGGPGAHSARLKLHPEHLGELDVEITMDEGTAQVWFGTTTAQARDAIESTLPRLRELFAEQGIQLTRTQVDAGGGQPGNSGFGQERRMTGDSGPWNEQPAWQRGRGSAMAGPVDATAGAPARLLDVWA